MDVCKEHLQCNWPVCLRGQQHGGALWYQNLLWGPSRPLDKGHWVAPCLPPSHRWSSEWPVERCKDKHGNVATMRMEVFMEVTSNLASTWSSCIDTLYFIVYSVLQCFPVDCGRINIWLLMFPGHLYIHIISSCTRKLTKSLMLIVDVAFAGYKQVTIMFKLLHSHNLL